MNEGKLKSMKKSLDKRGHLTNMDLFVSLNVSVNSFKNGHIKNNIKKVPLELRRNLNIEITERVFSEDSNEILNIMEYLKKLGFKLEIDDFGIGYSSLSYIEQIPADILKIDMSFIHKMIESEKTLNIVKTIINLAKSIEMKTIAEGVETKDQYEILRNLGCDFVQGYYFSKPLPFSEIKKLVTSKNL